MAIIQGISGSERELLQIATKHGFTARNIQEINDTRKVLEIALSAQKEKARNDINCEMLELRSQIEALRVEFGLSNLPSYISSYFKRTGKESRYNYLKQNTEEEINRRLKPIIEKVNRINDIVSTNEYSGACGEVTVINQLKKLPDEYHVFNDIHLELNKSMKFNGSYLKTARIDHIVIGPTGVYVIETKNWSEKMVRETFDKESYTPYEQVERAGYIVYRFLNSWRYRSFLEKIVHGFKGEEIKVFSILAVCGSRFPPSEKKYIKAMHPEKIPGYILNGSAQPSKDTVEAAVQILGKEL